MTEDKCNDLFWEGAYARQNSRAIETCPHPEDSETAHLWQCGWQDEDHVQSDFM